MVPRLNSVEALPGYQLRLSFADGTNGVVDVSGLAGKGVFNAWDEDDLFFRPYINETGTIAWNDFVDIDLLNVYLSLKGLTFEEWRKNQTSYASD